MRAFLVGRRPCRGVPVDYFLLVEEWDALWECYGIRVESGGGADGDPGSPPRSLGSCRCCPS